MEFNQEIIALFDGYSTGKMNAIEQQDFEKHLENEQNFAMLFEQYQAIVAGVKAHELTAVKDKINIIHEKLQKEQFFTSQNSKIITMNTEKKSPIRWLAAAAIFALAVGVWYFIQPKAIDATEVLAATSEDKLTTKSDDIAAKIIERLSAPGMATTTKVKDDSLKLALDLYKNDKYEEARVTLSEYLERYPEDDVAIAYLGLSLFQQAQYAKAAIHFNKVVLKKDFEYSGMVKWYLALCDFQFKDKSSILQAKGLFQELAKDPDSGYAKEAQLWLDLYFKK